MLYFGYGSNLHRADLDAWCADRGHDASGIRAVARAWWPDAAPVFHYHSRARAGGALSVRPRRGAVVPGVLFEVDQAGWRALDAKEGAPRTYRRVPAVVLIEGGDEVHATTYVVTEPYRRETLVPPTDAYLGLVTGGLGAHGLPDAPVRAAARALSIDAFPRAVFVYGTLMRDELRHPMVARHGPRRVANASVAGRLLDFGAYPGWVPAEGCVHGELVELDDPGDVLEELDEVEDFAGYGAPGSLYRRVVVDVRLDTGERELAWTYRYVGPTDFASPIRSGDWRAR